ncbi:MAG: cation:proton antiporter [Magnetovibrio sp.]|nr:cation:proton antiporter [Magnetovibrio sp.]
MHENAVIVSTQKIAEYAGLTGIALVVAGVLLGPSALAVVHDLDQTNVLAELGVLMLLFVIAMELSLRIFQRIWTLAVAVAVAVAGLQIAASVLVFWLLSFVFACRLKWRYLWALWWLCHPQRRRLKFCTMRTYRSRRTDCTRHGRGADDVDGWCHGRSEFEWMTAVSLTGAILLLAGLV